jgi:hypothetical protein
MGRAGARMGTADQPQVQQDQTQQPQDDLQLLLQEQALRNPSMPRVDLYNMAPERP